MQWPWSKLLRMPSTLTQSADGGQSEQRSFKLETKKRNPYSTFEQSILQDQKLSRLAAAKHLDIPWSEMDVHVTNSGLGGWGAALLGLATLVGGAGLGLGIASLLKSSPAIEKIIDHTKGVGVKYDAELIAPSE